LECGQPPGAYSWTKGVLHHGPRAVFCNPPSRSEKEIEVVSQKEEVGLGWWLGWKPGCSQPSDAAQATPPRQSVLRVSFATEPATVSPASPAEGRKAKTEQSRARASEGAPRGEGAFPIKNATEKEGEDWGKAKEKARSQVWGNRKPQRRRGVQGEAKRGGGGQQQQTKDAGQGEADRKRQERIPQQKRKRKRKGETRVGGPWKTWRKSLRAGKGTPSTF